MSDVYETLYEIKDSDRAKAEKLAKGINELIENHFNEFSEEETKMLIAARVHLELESSMLKTELERWAESMEKDLQNI